MIKISGFGVAILHDNSWFVNDTWFLQILGKAFGVPENSMRTYAEAEIRAG